MIRPHNHLALLALCSLAMSCSGGDSSSNEKPLTARSGAVIDTATAVSDITGLAAATFKIPSGVNKIGVTAITDAFISTHSVANDAGTLYVDDAAAELTTDSTFADSFVSSVNIPSRDVDPALTGSTLTVQNFVGGLGSDATLTGLSGHTVQYSLLEKSDPDLSSGALQINIAYVGSTASDPAIRAAIARAIPVFKSIYGQAGITLTVTEGDFAGADILPDPSAGDALYGTISTSFPAPAVNICVGQDLPTPGLLGQSSAIPGSPLPSVKSCVGVSALNAAGADGNFSDEDVRVLGETLAHEVGHYMGLFHPVEDGFDQYDDLSDTPQCFSEPNCNAVLGGNNMYYTPILDAAGNLAPQQTLSPQQRAVLNRYAAVD